MNNEIHKFSPDIQTSFLKKVLRACIPCWGLLIPIISVLRTNPHTDYTRVNELKWDHCGTGTFFFLLSQRSFEARKHLVHKLPLICTEIFQASLTIIKVPFSKCSFNHKLWRQNASFTTDSHALWISNILLICHCYIEDILPVPIFALESFWNGRDIWNWKWI